MIEVKERIVKETAGFRLRIKSWKCLTPNDLNSLEFIQECLDDKGEVSLSSTYNFFLTDVEIKDLCNCLQS